MRSEHQTDRILHGQRLSRKASENKTLRFGNRQNLCLLNQPFSFARNNDRGTLPLPLAGGVIFQMDQTASAYKGILWNY